MNAVHGWWLETDRIKSTVWDFRRNGFYSPNFFVKMIPECNIRHPGIVY